MTDIIPAIDLIEGRCVRLVKGDYNLKTVYGSSPVDMARRFEDSGVKRIHIVDLDGARTSEPVNLRTLEKIASSVSVELEWGGGIGTAEHLGSVFSAGATKAIVGSVAALSPELFEEWLGTWNEALILGADIRDGKVAVKGWMQEAETPLEELLSRFTPRGLRECICTDISRDGMLRGPSFGLYQRLGAGFPGIEFTASGGVSSMEDIRKLDSLGVPRAIVGKAIYEGHISFTEIEHWSRKAAGRSEADKEK